MSAILVIDDEQDMLALLRRIIADRTDNEVDFSDDPLKLSEFLSRKDYDIIITDLKMPGKNGIEVLQEAKAKNPQTAVIIMTAYGTIDSAIEATRKGAFDYITKPFRKERLLHIIGQALNWRQLQKENVLLRRQLETKSGVHALVGSSPPMSALLNQIEKVAKTSATVLITGESGTGKELVAPFPEPQERPAVYPDRLRHNTRNHYRKRTVRSPQGIVHRGFSRQERHGGGGKPRDSFPR